MRRKALGAAIGALLAGGGAPARAPEVFLLAGQSNMSGRGDVATAPAELRTAHSRIAVYGADGRLRPATEPLDDATGQVDAVSADPQAGVGPGLVFARALTEADAERRIVLVPCAKGGSAIAAWAPSPGRDSLYGSCVARAKEAVTASGGRVAGVLWWQGESDARDHATAAGWAAAFTALVERLRADLAAPTLPVLVVGLADPPESGPYAGRFPAWEAVRRAQAELRAPGVRTVPAAGLPRNPDRLHVSTAGQIEMGRRLAQAWPP